MTQAQLFGATAVEYSISGLVYQPDFLSPEEEQQLIGVVRSLPLEAARYKQYLAKRRIASFGGSFDFDSNRLGAGVDLDLRLIGLRNKVAQWLQVGSEDLVHALVAEYAPGTPLGWHRDVPDFEAVAGVSLGGHAKLRFRPYPHQPGPRKVVELDAAPRSVYKLEGQARWAWQHSVAPTTELRWSITFRTRRQD